MISKRIFVSMVVTLSLVQFITCGAIKPDENNTHSSQLQSEEGKSVVNNIYKDSSEFQTATKENSSEEIVSLIPKEDENPTGQNAVDLEVPKVHGYLTEHKMVTMMKVPSTEEDASSATSEDTEETQVAQPADSYVQLYPATL